jgi:hypothetical protein
MTLDFNKKADELHAELKDQFVKRGLRAMPFSAGIFIMSPDYPKEYEIYKWVIAVDLEIVYDKKSKHIIIPSFDNDIILNPYIECFNYPSFNQVLEIYKGNSSTLGVRGGRMVVLIKEDGSCFRMPNDQVYNRQTIDQCPESDDLFRLMEYIFIPESRRVMERTSLFKHELVERASVV